MNERLGATIMAAFWSAVPALATAGMATLLTLAPAQNASALEVEKALTTSARDYAASKGNSLRDYVLKGVHDYYGGNYLNCLDKLIKKAPPSTEVIVDVRYGSYGCSGTALIPSMRPTSPSPSERE